MTMRSVWTRASRAIGIRRAISRMRRSRADDLHGPTDQRQPACHLAFGTSTRVLGFRKFPNPRFDAARWRSLNGSMGDVGPA